ncbi:MAG: A/G-specific adenine glycosylase [Ferruginibacter sp.]
MNKSTKRKLFTETLLLWNKKLNKRAMPWKGEKDPYKIWLSEIILQQTRVEQGLEYYRRFIKKYPFVDLLATAGENEVFKLWEGLGYYSRCRNLIASARHISFELGGIFPDDHDSIRRLKGVGPYTAAAIASFAYNLPYAVSDGNVQRLLARFFGIAIPIDGSDGKKYITALADQLLDKNTPAIYNQAIMDFGAVICKPKLPLCEQCILRPNCTAYRKGIVNLLPVKEKKLLRKNRYFFYIVAEYGGRIYVRQRTGKDIWQGLWEFILTESPQKISAEDFLRSPAYLNLARQVKTNPTISAIFKQQLTHQTVEGVFIRVKLKAPLKDDLSTGVTRAAFRRLAFPRMINNFLENIGTGSGQLPQIFPK